MWSERLLAVRQLVWLASPEALSAARSLLRDAPQAMSLQDEMALHELVCRAAWAELRFPLMLRHARILEKLAKLSGEFAWQIEAQQLLASAYYDQRRYDQSLACWVSSLELAQSNGSDAALCEACLGMSNILLADQQMQEARQVLELACNQAQRSGINRLSFKAGLYTANFLAQQNDLTGLAQCLVWLKQLPLDDIEEPLLIDVENTRARLLCLQNDTQAAESVLQAATARAYACRYLWGSLQAQFIAADLAATRGQFDVAIAAAHSALNAAREANGCHFLPHDFMLKLGRWQEEFGQLDDALATLEQWHKRHRADLLARHDHTHRIAPSLLRQLSLLLQVMQLKDENKKLRSQLQSSWVPEYAT
jgi:tetratricopeptide (TPR) repeat protein